MEPFRDLESATFLDWKITSINKRKTQQQLKYVQCNDLANRLLQITKTYPIELAFVQSCNQKTCATLNIKESQFVVGGTELMAEEKLLYINVAWMTYYMGPNGDKAEGNFGYMKENPGAVVHESWNFKPINGKVYGYVPRSARIDIANLGATLEDQLIENVTVVWISRDPRVKKTVIVGWYRNATIHRRADHIRKKRNQYISVGYQIEAPEEHTVLLSTDARVFKIPTGNKKGSLGQSPIWYGSNQAFNRDVLRYIKNGGLKPKSNLIHQTLSCVAL